MAKWIESSFSKPTWWPGQPVVLLASPRGFCAGVARAIRIVELALERGGPVWVRHEIVHNRAVVDALRARGAKFVDELDEVPEGATVVFSAHGVSEAVERQAADRGLDVLDATCPLVAKVHREVVAHALRGRHVALIGHGGHPEVAGTLGRLAPDSATLIERPEDVDRLPEGVPLAYATQTTLSLDDAAATIARLVERHPSAVGPARDDICYATTNRQAAVKALACEVEAVIVVGSPNSSNSNRLCETAERAGIPAQLVNGPADLDWEQLTGVKRVGVTAGASAPEERVRSVVAALADRLGIAIVAELPGPAEPATFPLPHALRDQKRRP